MENDSCHKETGIVSVPLWSCRSNDYDYYLIIMQMIQTFEWDNDYDYYVVIMQMIQTLEGNNDYYYLLKIIQKF